MSENRMDEAGNRINMIDENSIGLAASRTRNRSIAGTGKRIDLNKRMVTGDKTVQD